MTNWYVSSLAGGGGSGSEVSPWTLSESITNINNSTVLAGDIVWVKADGVYYMTSTYTISVSGTTNLLKIFAGYTSTIGDNGRATIQRTSGTGYMFDWYPRLYWLVRNIIFDANNIAGSYGVGAINTYGFAFINCIVKNAPNYGAVRGIWINCQFNDLGGESLYEGRLFYCLLTNCSLTNGVNISHCIVKGIHANPLVYSSQAYIENCIFDGSSIISTHLIYMDVGRIINSIIVNHNVAGKYALCNTNIGCLITNCNFYNNLNNILTDVRLNSVSLDPQFNDIANNDYTRVGINLDNLGLSKIGLISSIPNYNIDIGIDQKTSIINNVFGMIS
ncbi:MAG: hypothetical protein V1901_03740 [Patescibacteria group bacterium]